MIQKYRLLSQEKGKFPGRWVITDIEAVGDLDGHESGIETELQCIEKCMVSKKFRCVVDLCNFGCEGGRGGGGYGISGGLFVFLKRSERIPYWYLKR